MFNKLKIKLTVFNIAIIGTIFIIISLVILFGSPNTSSKKLSQEMWLVAIEGNATKGSSKLFATSNRYKDYLYVKVDDKGNIINTLPEDLSNNNLGGLVQRALEMNDYTGEIKVDENNKFSFLKVFLDKEQGATLVFTNLDRKNHILLSFILRSSFVIIFGLILVFIGSLLISEKALIPIKKAWQNQMNFTADASHELRTPLAVIQTNLELVLGNPEETVHSQKDWLENILIENKRMTKLVDDLLTLSRADAKQKILQVSPLMIDKTLRKAVLIFEIMASAKDITLNLDIQSEVEFVGDQNRLKQLFIILIDNALHYTDNGGQVNVHLKVIEKCIEISVEDTGEGIEKEHLEKIFYRFYRVDKTRAKNEGGSGLGLAVAKWIVDEHKGQIKVQSIPGEGTRFVVLLPKNQ